MIPAGAVRISIGDDGRPAMEVTHVQAAVQTWPDWVSIAFARFGDAKATRRRMIEATAAGDDAAESGRSQRSSGPLCKLSPPLSSASMRSMPSSARWSRFPRQRRTRGGNGGPVGPSGWLTPSVGHRACPTISA